MEQKNRKNNRETGAFYERLAGNYLEKKGYQILEYNFRCRCGEIDLIARDGKTIVFCEVKYRKDSGKGHPYEAVGRRKQRTICRCARSYINRSRRQGAACRFDVVSIEGERLVHYKSAFEYVE